MPITLIPVSRGDRDLMELMIRPTSPRWMRVAACLALEGRRVVLPKDGHPVLDACGVCEVDGLCDVRAFHKNAAGDDVRCLVLCGACGAMTENRPFDVLARRAENPLRGIPEAF